MYARIKFYSYIKSIRIFVHKYSFKGWGVGKSWLFANTKKNIPLCPKYAMPDYSLPSNRIAILMSPMCILSNCNKKKKNLFFRFQLDRCHIKVTRNIYPELWYKNTSVVPCNPSKQVFY